VLRNYPVVGHFRSIFSSLGEFFRQYFFAMDREEMPFNRAERDWVHRAANNTANKPIKKTNSVDKASKTGVAVSNISIMFCVFILKGF
jgi:hypothetical protein